MTIRMEQFDGQYTAQDVATMNVIAAEAISEIQGADISDDERKQIVAAIENNVSGTYDPDIEGCPGTVDLIPVGWRRLLSARKED